MKRGYHERLPTGNFGLARPWILLALGAIAGDERDFVLLESGKRLEGRVVYEDRQLLILRQGTRDTEIVMDDVQRVDSLVRSLDALLDRELENSVFDLEQGMIHAELARECKLDGMAELLAWRVLAVDQQHEAAHRFLEHRARPGGWLVPLGGRWVPLKKRRELASDWGSAWEFSTLHYRLTANVSLDLVLDAAIDLERLYQGFFELFGAELKLYEVMDPMAVHLHGDKSSYPENGAEIGRYDALEDTLRVDASGGLAMDVLIHEATHQLVYDTAVRERAHSGEIPGWLDEGLADYVAGCTVGERRRLALEPGRPNAERFRVHALAKKPMKLSRVLNLANADFWATSRLDLKYAQAATLVHFGLHGAGGRYREGFLDYLRSAYAGQASSTDFKKCMKVDMDELEAAWKEHVQQVFLELTKK